MLGNTFGIFNFMEDFSEIWNNIILLPDQLESDIHRNEDKSDIFEFMQYYMYYLKKN